MIIFLLTMWIYAPGTPSLLIGAYSSEEICEEHRVKYDTKNTFALCQILRVDDET